jgi:hypothetical protein
MKTGRARLVAVGAVLVFVLVVGQQLLGRLPDGAGRRRGEAGADQVAAPDDILVAVAEQIQVERRWRKSRNLGAV